MSYLGRVKLINETPNKVFDINSFAFLDFERGTAAHQANIFLIREASSLQRKKESV